MFADYMSPTPKAEVDTLATLISLTNGGKVLFNAKETSEIFCINVKDVPLKFQAEGILATIIDKRKLYAVTDIARPIYKKRVSPLQGRQ